jgi:peptidoglycan-associated lipoprotein
MKQSRLLLAVVALMPFVFAGCATEPASQAPVEDRTGEPAPQGETASATEKSAAGSAVEAGAELLAKRRVYFAFDSSSIDEESRAIIEAHATHLAANTSIKVRLEGNCDERGTREYNLALGERRAQAVERIIRALGVGAERITPVSYGEEKPVALDHNESAWRQNRRVEIVY